MVLVLRLLLLSTGYCCVFLLLCFFALQRFQIVWRQRLLSSHLCAVVKWSYPCVYYLAWYFDVSQSCLFFFLVSVDDVVFVLGSIVGCRCVKRNWGVFFHHLIYIYMNTNIGLLEHDFLMWNTNVKEIFLLVDWCRWIVSLIYRSNGTCTMICFFCLWFSVRHFRMAFDSWHSS